MLLLKRTLLVSVLIVASLVTPSTATSAWAMPNESLRQLSEAEQRTILNRIILEVFPRGAAARMQAIAWCESRGRHVVANGSLLRNHSGTFYGALQVAWHVHQRDIERLEHEQHMQVRANLRDYVRFNLILYHQDKKRGGDGFRPWPRCRERTTSVDHTHIDEDR